MSSAGMSDQPKGPSAPLDSALILCISVVISVICMAVVWFYGPQQPQSQFVQFDIHKYTSAQRALLANSDLADGINLNGLTDLAASSAGLQKAIREVAGPGTIVLVKAAVVSAEVPEITDIVLRRLGLPIDVKPIPLALDGVQTGPAPSVGSHNLPVNGKEKDEAIDKILKEWMP